MAVFVSLSGSAVAAAGLVRSGDIASHAVTSDKIRNGSITLRDMHAATLRSLRGTAGAAGLAGIAGTNGSRGADGPAGSNGINGPNGIDGRHGTNGTNGLNGLNGVDGDDGATGDDGIQGETGSTGIGTTGPKGDTGSKGDPGTNGTNGVIAPLSTRVESKALLTATPPTTVVQLAVPAGNYVVFAKSQLSHTGAGDSVTCVLKANTTVIDEVAMKTMPALAALPVSLQAVTTGSPTQLSVECDVATAGGAADANSLIAIPIG